MSISKGSINITDVYRGLANINNMYLGANNVFNAIHPNTGEIYRNEFESLDGLTLDTINANITTQAPIGTAVLPNNALTIEWINTGKSYAGVDLGQAYNELYIQFYVSVIDRSDNSGYKDCFQVGNNINGNSEASELKVNYSATYHRLYGLPSYQSFAGKHFAKCEVARVGIHLNRGTLTADYYYNGEYIDTKPCNDQDFRYLTFGGSNNAGTIIQYSDITVNEIQFSQNTQNNFGIGLHNSAYIDYSMDNSIDASSFTGMHPEPITTDGGLTYIDGPKRYSKDLSTNYLLPKDLKILYKNGVKHKISDLASSHKFGFSPTFTNENEFYTVEGYGESAEMPMIDTSIVIDSGSWTVYDAVNNIYSTPLANSGNLQEVWVDEYMALRQGTVLTDLETVVGLSFIANGILYVRMYDDSNPATHTIDVVGNQGFSINDYCILQNVKKRLGGSVIGNNSIMQYCEGTIGGSVSVSSGGRVQYNNFYKNWKGGRYDDQEYGGGGNTINVGAGGICVYNHVEDSYIGIQATFDANNALIAFNVVKNIIINHIQVSGGDGASLGNPENSLKIINNTVFSSPRQLSNDPYFMPISGLGHGIVIQTGTIGGDYAFVDIINNLVMLHYNWSETLPNSNVTANCIHIANPNDKGAVDYNRVYISENSDQARAGYFTNGQWTTYEEFVTAISTNGKEFTGIDRVSPPCQNSKILTGAIPVQTANSTTSSGKWLETDATPTSNEVIGQGYEYDFSQWGITETMNGTPLTASRNIGAY